MTDIEQRKKAALKPCAFCGGKAVFGLGKKIGCQLHGEPMQAATASCNSPKCHAKPFMSAGDIYNGGIEKAREEVAEKWNKRTLLQPTPSEWQPIKRDMSKDRCDVLLYNMETNEYWTGKPWMAHAENNVYQALPSPPTSKEGV